MNRNTIVMLVLAVLAFGGYLFHKDYSYRQANGQVTSVDLFNYEQEVEKVQDTKPVLIYFYKQGRNDPADEAQMKVVKDFAWRNAYDVKVVSVNIAQLENLPLAIANGAVRQPAFVFVSAGKQVSGQNGRPASVDELNRLHGLILNQP